MILVEAKTIVIAYLIINLYESQFLFNKKQLSCYLFKQN